MHLSIQYSSHSSLISHVFLLRFPQIKRTPLDVAEAYSKEEAAGVLRRHGAKRGGVSV